jgi:hypothetical protein
LAGEDMTVRYESAPGSFPVSLQDLRLLTPGKASYLETVSTPPFVRRRSQGSAAPARIYVVARALVDDSGRLAPA